MKKIAAIIAMIIGVFLLFYLTNHVGNSVMNCIIVVLWLGLIIRDWVREVSKIQRLSTTGAGIIFILSAIGALRGDLGLLAVGLMTGVLITAWFYNRN